ncbi:MAG: NAD(P)-dependent oxidoreductase [Verrucomicrobiota bacterium]
MSESRFPDKIGFLGLGNMGWPMAKHLQAVGADLLVWNRSEARRNEAAEGGFRIGNSPAQVAEEIGVGVVCVNLTHASVVEEVVFSFLPSLEPGSVVVDFGTTGYEATLRLAKRVRKAGAEWIDAPVSGGQVGAEAGNLTIMCGGEEATFQRVLSILETVGEKITLVGGCGAGQVTKLANQLIVAQTIDAVAQALRLAELAGLDSARVREALRGGFAESRILELHGDRMVRRDFEPGGRSELQLKDVRLMSELAEQVGLESSTLENSLKLWEEFVDERGHADLDHSGLMKLYE